MNSSPVKLWDAELIRQALRGAVYKLDPRVQWRNPVMFVVYVGSLLVTLLCVQAFLQGYSAGFTLSIALWLWFTVLFANFAEAFAEGRSQAQAASLKHARQDVMAKKLSQPQPDAAIQSIAATRLTVGDWVLVQAGDIVPADGEAVRGVATVDESAITGESAPVIRESGGDFSAVTGGTRLLSDWLVVRVIQVAGQGFLDRMIALVEGASRQKTPNEIALTILLTALTLIFLVVCVTLLPFSIYAVNSSGQGQPIDLIVLVALLVCLIPTTIGGLLSAIGVAGMSRMMAANVIATSGRAVEAAGDVDVLLLDKTGTITHGNPLTAAAIAIEAGVDDFMAEATPEAKLARIRQYQAEGKLVAMTGDGTNDAPALAQADVAVAMNSGTQAAKEAANMVDLDSNPTKLIEVVKTGKQMLMTRGALTTFSLANDLAKYFSIIPAAFATTYPALNHLNLMQLGSPNSAILSAVIFNALVIVGLIPLAIRGVTYRPCSAAQSLRRNLLIYGGGGVLLPFVAIKLIDLGLNATGWV